MIQKGAATLAVLALVALSPSINGQTNRPAGTSPLPLPPISSPAHSSPSLTTPAASPATASPQAAPGAAEPNSPNPAGSADCPGGNCDLPPPHITIATPAPAPAAWSWQQRISWGANLVLVVVAYIGIMMAVSLLRKIDRQGQLIEDAAQSAATSARAALTLVEAKSRTERPWLLMSVRPVIGAENTFSVIATNRGSGPARIAASVEEIVCAVDEKHLSATPTFTKEPAAPQEPIILLPEETFELMVFSRDDVNQVSETEERFKRIEDWEEKIFLYGKVTYRDLTAPEDAPAHESSWMCWYIHGRQKSGMVMAGPPAYNSHT
jgi:hypothetical protein